MSVQPVPPNGVGSSPLPIGTEMVPLKDKMLDYVSGAAHALLSQAAAKSSKWVGFSNSVCRWTFGQVAQLPTNAKKTVAFMGSAYLQRATSTLNHSELLSRYLSIMRSEMGEPFANLHTFLSKLFQPYASSLLKDSLGFDSKLSIALSEVICAKLFANLASEVKKNQVKIDRFQEQSPLVNTLSFIAIKVKESVDTRAFVNCMVSLESKKEKLWEDIRGLFYIMANTKEKKRELEKEVQGYFSLGNPQERKKYLDQLFSKYEKLACDNYHQNLQDIISQETLKNIVDGINQIDEIEAECKHYFLAISQALISCFLPQGLSDLDDLIWIPSHIKKPLFGKLSSILSGYLSELFIFSAVKSSNENRWKEVLKTFVGEADVSNILKAASGAFSIVARSALQSSLALTDKLSEAVVPHASIDDKQCTAALRNDTSAEIKTTLTTDSSSIVHDDKSDSTPEEEKSEEREKRLLRTFDRLAYQPLVHSFVEQVQTILHTDDQNVKEIVQFIKPILDHFILGAVAEGSLRIFGPEMQSDPLQFIHNAVEMIKKRFAVLNADHVLLDTDWRELTREFVHSLPVPPLLFDMTVDVFVRIAKQTFENMKYHGFAIKELSLMETTTREEIEKYSYGQTVLFLAKSVSGQIVGELPLNIDEITEKLELDEIVEKFSAKYLPELTKDEELREWFNENIHAVERKKDEFKQFAQETLEVFLRKVFLSFIKKHLVDGKIEIADLVKSTISIFSDVFSDINFAKKEELRKALKISEEINILRSDLESCLEELSACVDQIRDSLEHMQSFERLTHLYTHLYDTKASIHALTHEKTLLAEDFNQVFNKIPFSKLQAALDVYHEKFNALDREVALSLLERDIQLQLEQKAAVGLSDAAQEELELFQLLHNLLQMEDLGIRFFKLFDLEMTLQRASKEESYLENQIKEILRHSDEAVFHAASVKEKQLNLESHIQQLEQLLGDQLAPFRELSLKLTQFLGLCRKEDIDLPDVLQTHVFKLLQQLQKTQIPMILFREISPVLITLYEANDHEEKLSDSPQNKRFAADLVGVLSKNIEERSSKFIIEYHSIAMKILSVTSQYKETGVPITEDQVKHLELQIQEKLFFKGCECVSKSMLYPVLKEVSFATSMAKKEVLIALLTKIKTKVPLTKEIVASVMPFSDKKDEFFESVANRLNRLVLDCGKASLTSSDLVDAWKSTLKRDELVEMEQKYASLRKSTAEDLIELSNEALISLQELVSEGSEDEDTPFEGDFCVSAATLEDAIESALISQRVVESIKIAIISPQELAEIIISSDWPDSKDLQIQVASEVQTMLQKDNENFAHLASFLGQFTRGAALKLCARICEKHKCGDREDVLVKISKKLEELAEKSEPLPLEDGKWENYEEVAHRLIDQIFSDVFTIPTGDDLKTIPPLLRKIVYEKLHVFAYFHFTPVIVPIIERKALRKELDVKSGSSFFKLLASTLSRDIFQCLLPRVIDYQEFAKEIIKMFLKRGEFDESHVEALSEEISLLVQQGNLKNKTIIESCAKVFEKDFDKDFEVDFKTKLKKSGIKQKIQRVWFSPKSIVDNLRSLKIGEIDDDLARSFERELSSFLHGENGSYLHISKFLGCYVEGVLLKLFVKIAEKNPPKTEDGKLPKDSLVIIAEKTLATIFDGLSHLSGNRDMASKRSLSRYTQTIKKNMVENLGILIMKTILSIDSPESLQGVPDLLQGPIYDVIKGGVRKFLQDISQTLEALDNTNDSVLEAKIASKKMSCFNAQNTIVEVLANDISHQLMGSMPHLLARIVDPSEEYPEMYGTVVCTRGISKLFKELSKEKLHLARLFLNFPFSPYFKDLSEHLFRSLDNPKRLLAAKQMIAEKVANFMIAPINRVCQRMIDFEERHGEKMTQELMRGVLSLSAAHFRHLNIAKELSKAKGRSTVRHSDFVEAVSLAAANDPNNISSKQMLLHEGVITEKLTFERSIDRIMMLIKGKKNTVKTEDITYWKSTENDILALIKEMVKKDQCGIQVFDIDDFCSALQAIFHRGGVVLSPSIIQSIKAPIRSDFDLSDLIFEEANVHASKKHEHFYKRASKSLVALVFPNGLEDLTFIAEDLRGPVWNLIKKTAFPQLVPIITETLLDPDMINTMVLSSLENTRDALNVDIEITQADPSDKPDMMDDIVGELVAEALKLGEMPHWLKKRMVDPKTGKVGVAMQRSMGAALRRQFNDTFIQDKLKVSLAAAVRRTPSGDPVIRHSTPSSQAIKAARLQMKCDLRRASREVVDATISYTLRSYWKSAQVKFDAAIEKVFGKLGKRVKAALDAVFRFIFFKIAGSFLLFFLNRDFTKEILYKIISLDSTMDKLLEQFRAIPEDSPIEGSRYAVMHEDLIFKVGDYVMDVVQKYMDYSSPSAEFEGNDSFTDPPEAFLSA